MQLKTFTSGQQFIRSTVNHITELCLQKQGSSFIALSGGKTPGPVYEALAKNDELNFDAIEWFAVDERAVSFDHQHSNYKMIKKAFAKAEPKFAGASMMR